MTQPPSPAALADLLSRFADHGGPFGRSVLELVGDPTFVRYAGRLADWACQTLGPSFAEILVDGYASFVTDVNRCQMEYEVRGSYPDRTYAQVFSEVYGNPRAMAKYHWGVFCSTVAWEHHLRLLDLFERDFLPRLPARGDLIELASGSGVWSALTVQDRPGWSGLGIDISATSVTAANALAQAAGLGQRLRFIEGDAMAADPGAGLAQAGISCFVLEHLPDPQRLLDQLASRIEAHGHAFVTAALTAAEVDHIREFRRESEIISMAERAGFRLVACLSSAPRRYPAGGRFLPRSIGLVLQRRRGEWW